MKKGRRKKRERHVHKREVDWWQPVDKGCVSCGTTTQDHHSSCDAERQLLAPLARVAAHTLAQPRTGFSIGACRADAALTRFGERCLGDASWYGRPVPG